MKDSATSPVALDIGLCLLTIEPVQLTVNQAYAVKALLNARKRVRLHLEIDLGRGPAVVSLVIAAESPDNIEEN